MKRANKIIRVFLVIGVIFFLVVLGGFLWMKNSYQPLDVAYDVLMRESEIEINEGEYISFVPKDTKVTTGFIFYPGGKVEYKAYAPLCNAIAKEGYFVAIVPMELNLAILSPDRADQVIEEHPEISNWVIGGHSLGGVMASKYAASHDVIKALVLYAAYPKGNELLNKDMIVLSMYGSEDKIANLDKVKGAMLGNNVILFEIAGGNHSYFGSYGSQRGDGQATIRNEEQIRIAAQYTVAVLREVETMQP